MNEIPEKESLYNDKRVKNRRARAVQGDRCGEHRESLKTETGIAQKPRESGGEARP